MSTASEKINLTRIRDNQRRSRARRKHYLKELEARLRQYELRGIEASAELQRAARKVADENKKLRDLVAQYGIGDDIVEEYLQPPLKDDMLHFGQFASCSSSMQILEQSLQSRKAFYPDETPSSIKDSELVGRCSRDGSASLNTAQSIFKPIRQQETRRFDLQSTEKAALFTHQFMTPSISGSRANDANLGHASLARDPSQVPDQSSQTPTTFDVNAQPCVSNLNGSHPSIAEQSLYAPLMFDLNTQSLVSNQDSSYANYLSVPMTAGSLSVNSYVFSADMIT